MARIKKNKEITKFPYMTAKVETEKEKAEMKPGIITVLLDTQYPNADQEPLFVKYHVFISKYHD